MSRKKPRKVTKAANERYIRKTLRALEKIYVDVSHHIECTPSLQYETLNTLAYVQCILLAMQEENNNKKENNNE